MIIIIIIFKKYFFFWDVVFHFVRFLPSKLWTPWRRDQTDNDDDIGIMRMWHHPEMMLHYLIPLTWYFHGTLNAEVSITLGTDSSAAAECPSAAQFREVQAAVSSSIFCLQELQKSQSESANADATKMCVSYSMLYSGSLQKNKKDIYITPFHCMMCNFLFSVLDVFRFVMNRIFFSVVWCVNTKNVTAQWRINDYNKEPFSTCFSWFVHK